MKIQTAQHSGAVGVSMEEWIDIRGGGGRLDWMEGNPDEGVLSQVRLNAWLARKMSNSHK